MKVKLRMEEAVNARYFEIKCERPEKGNLVDLVKVYNCSAVVVIASNRPKSSRKSQQDQNFGLVTNVHTAIFELKFCQYMFANS